MLTTLADARPAATASHESPSLVGAEAADLFRRFPARPRPTAWPETSLSRDALADRLRHLELALPGPELTRRRRRRGARILLDWLEIQPGDTWQQRWLATPAATTPDQWYAFAQEWARTSGAGKPKTPEIQAGMQLLICADVIRPDLAWLLGTVSRTLRPAIRACRDPEGFARLEAAGIPIDGGARATAEALKAIVRIMVAYGGTIEDITVGDFLATQAAASGTNESRGVRLAYHWLREQGRFPSDAPETLISFARRSGQVTPGMLVDRYQLKSQPIPGALRSRPWAPQELLSIMPPMVQLA